MEMPKIIDLKRSIDIQYVVLRIDTFNQMLGADKRRLVMKDVSCATEFAALDEVYSVYKANDDAVSLISVDLRSGETKTLYTRRHGLADPMRAEAFGRSCSMCARSRGRNGLLSADVPAMFHHCRRRTPLRPTPT